METLLAEVMEYLDKAYAPELVFLYGSYASEMENSESDIDIIAFADVDENKHDSSIIGNHMLDAWIYPKKEMGNTDLMLHIIPCRTLQDKGGNGESIRQQILEARARKVKRMTNSEKKQLDDWILKMLHRAEQNTIEGDYRYTWLLYDFPELYCQYHAFYYDGPIKTIKWLENNDTQIYKAYSKLLDRKNTKNINEVALLYKKITCST